MGISLSCPALVHAHGGPVAQVRVVRQRLQHVGRPDRDVPGEAVVAPRDGVEAAAAGSGIPEAKAYLNGVNYSRYLALRCGAVKAVAVVLSVASGLVVGREGPLIHVGAVVGGVLRRRRRSRDVERGSPRTADRGHRRVR